jgi:hypothetical protein
MRLRPYRIPYPAVMRILAYLVAVALLVPQTLIFAAATLLDHVTATRTFLGFLNTTLDTLNLMFGWGGVAVLVVAGFVIGCGFSDKCRPAAAVFVLLVDVYTAGYVLLWAGVKNVAFFLMPGTLAAGLCVWMIRRDFMSRRLSGMRSA